MLPQPRIRRAVLRSSLHARPQKANPVCVPCVAAVKCRRACEIHYHGARTHTGFITSEEEYQEALSKLPRGGPAN